MIFSLQQHSIYRSIDDIGTQGCPPALKCLVFVWDELNKDFQAFVNKIMADKENKDAMMQPKSNSNDVNEIDYPKGKLKTKKFVDEGNTPLGAVGGSNESTVWCELCDTEINPSNIPNPYQQNTFTQHLKTCHPGCGESAKGKGYNSNGVYCEGWAGQCGEEGVGATSWYLMCEPCRDKFMVPNKKTLNVNDSLLTRAAAQDQKLLPPPTINPSTFSKKSKFSSNMSMEFFDTMKDNALFLLDLNSHNGGLMNKTAGNNLMPLKNKVAAARHSSASEFLAQPNTSNFSNRLSGTVIEENLRKTSLQKQNSITNYCGKKYPVAGETAAPELLWTPPESITCLEMLNAKISESESCNVFSLDDRNAFDPLMLGHQQQNQAKEGASVENKFHRSFSMIQGWGFYSHDPLQRELSSHECSQSHQTSENKVVMRRKKTCLCDSSELNILQHFWRVNLIDISQFRNSFC
jgi:E3 ubiquitin-protein ligase MYCBP2